MKRLSPHLRAVWLAFVLTLVFIVAVANGDEKRLKDQAAARPKPPNIVFILLDDLGSNELGCYGQEKFKTPNIDRLAAEGMRFTQCYSGSHVCAPSRSALMTGLHTGHTPIRYNGGGMFIDDADVTIAEVLKTRGYATGGFGKWGLGVEGSPGHPNRQGFDHFFGQFHQVHAHFYYPYFLWGDETRFMLPENEGGKRGRYAHDVIHQEALKYIRDNHERPFFAYLPYTIPHVELVVPEDSLAPYRGKFPEEPLPDPRPGYIGAEEPYATFAGMVSRVDRHVGEVLALLEELKIDENTVVFLSSDNGAQGDAWKRMTDFFKGNGSLRGYKGSFYEGGIRVPLLVRWLGRVKAGSTSDHVCAFWDMLPTLAEIAGAEPLEKTDGISFVPTLLGEPIQREHGFLYWEHPIRDRSERAVRAQNWKAIQARDKDSWELYNLDEDPGETKDVAAEHPDIVKRLAEFADQSHEPPRMFTPESPPVTIKTYVR